MKRRPNYQHLMVSVREFPRQWREFRAWQRSGGRVVKNSSRSTNQLLRPQPLSDNQLLAIAPITQQLIRSQLRILLQKELGYLQVERQRRIEAELQQQIRQKRQESSKKFLENITIFFNFYFIIALLMGGMGVVGFLVGINLPQSIDCLPQHQWCYQLRLRK